MKEKLLHKPTGFGHGKWEDSNSLRKYLKKRKKKKSISKESRKRNR